MAGIIRLIGVLRADVMLLLDRLGIDSLKRTMIATITPMLRIRSTLLQSALQFNRGVAARSRALNAALGLKQLVNR
jgi:hypothetical protein